MESERKPYNTFTTEIPVNDPIAMEAFQEAMDAQADTWDDEIKRLAVMYDISETCAADVAYLRTRSRWTEENEKKLIQLHRENRPPNICDWP